MNVMYISEEQPAYAKHSLKYILTATSGIPNFPAFVAVAVVNDVEIGYCDSNRKHPEPKTKWLKNILQQDPQHLEWYMSKCVGNQYDLRANMESLKQRFNKSGGVHIFQRMNGCEWDDKTGVIEGFNQYGYNGENFLTFDLNTLTWVAPSSLAVFTKHDWDRDRNINLFWKNALTFDCTNFLKKYVTYGKDSLLSTVRPSVSFLQTSPSSPVSCHATGFYPDRATMFWTIDGEELHEDVDHGEILPNQDGTFQMTVDLNISSVKPEDWTRYDCVFQLYGVKDDIITKLDKTNVRTNGGSSSELPAAAVTGVMAGLMLLLTVYISAFIIWKKKGVSGFQLINRTSKE
ncbi:hypothetical protein Q5P01_018708 [Channa striata]|uniref:Ig-like domain-containing protein n=1 Tax=Channa striata TaxID=64152 RepID=A0AA88M6A1_CHASR|nr:hypothetical protein Q5P01_018708 [Channa striata]